MYTGTGRKDTFQGQDSAAVRTTTFRVMSASDLKVYSRIIASPYTEIALTDGVDFNAVVGDTTAGPATVAITPTTAIPAALEWIAYRDEPRTQTTDYIAGDDFAAASHEKALDRKSMGLDDADDYRARSLHISVLDTDRSMELPREEARASKYLYFDSSGLPSAVSVVTGAGEITVTDIGEDIITALNVEAVRTLLSSVVNGGNVPKIQAGTIAAIPTPGTAGANAWYLATNEYILYHSNGSAWTAMSIGQSIYDSRPAAALANRLAIATDTKELYRDNGSGWDLIRSLPRGHLVGFDLGRSAPDYVSIEAGMCRDTTDTFNIEGTSNWTKDLTATWAAGSTNGCRPAAISYAASSDYHVFVLTNSLGGYDVAVDTNLDGDTIKADSTISTAGWTHLRRIGTVYTDGTPDILDFYQKGDLYLFKDPIHYSDTTDHTAGALLTLRVPIGLKVEPILDMTHKNTAGGDPQSLRVYSPNVTNTAPAVEGTATPGTQIAWHDANELNYVTGQITGLLTDASGRIRYRSHHSGGDSYFNLVGYRDTRGRLTY